MSSFLVFRALTFVLGVGLIAGAVYAIRDPLARVRWGSSVKDFEENPEEAKANVYFIAHLYGTLAIIFGTICIFASLYYG